ncbi:MAG: ABC transporter permease [Firmicutes bacterium]|nr:ABC transporter permease [Bacillota bacterium]
MNVPDRFYVAAIVAGRELRSTLYGLSLYLTLSLVLVTISYLGIGGAFFQIGQSGMAVLSNPVTGPFFLTSVLMAIYLGSGAALSFARERERGTAEVLFYGPVDSISYVLGKYLHSMLAFMVVAVLTSLYYLFVSALTGLQAGMNLLWFGILAIFLASAVIALGEFFACFVRRGMMAVVAYLAVAAIFILFSLVHGWMISIPGEQLSDTMIYLRIFLDRLDMVMQWVSPVAYFNRGQVAVAHGNAIAFGWTVAELFVYAVTLLACATLVLRRRGVRP